MTGIQQLFELENELVAEAYEKFGEVLVNTDNLIILAGDFVGTVKLEGWLFISFFSQVLNALHLSLMSLLRQHMSQAQMILRYAIESSCLACYALYNYNRSDYLELDSRGAAVPKKGISSKAYKWLERKYPTFSEQLKFRKNMINEHYAHGGLFPAMKNYKFLQTGDMQSSFFDKEDRQITEAFIWQIGNLTCWMLDLFLAVLNDYPHISVQSDFEEKFLKLKIQNERIRQLLAKEERFARWKDEK